MVVRAELHPSSVDVPHSWGEASGRIHPRIFKVLKELLHLRVHLQHRNSKAVRLQVVELNCNEIEQVMSSLCFGL